MLTPAQVWLSIGPVDVELEPCGHNDLICLWEKLTAHSGYVARASETGSTVAVAMAIQLASHKKTTRNTLIII
jgi:hypothetical protein